MINGIKKIKLLSIVALIIVLLIIGSIYIVDLLRNARVNILIAPINTEVKIDGKKVEGSTRFYPKSNVLVELSKNGFKKKEFYVDLKANETTLIHDFLEHEEKGINYYLNNKKDLELLKIIQNDETKEFFDNLEKKLRIIKVLPIKNTIQNLNGETEYTEIINAANNECVACLRIKTSYGNNIEKIQKVFSSYGFNYDDYYIVSIN